MFNVARLRTRLWSIAVLLFVLSPFAPPAFAATFTVTNTGDSGPGSLRQAILDAKALNTQDTIAFAIGSGTQTIQPLTPLPMMENATILDGRTQPGFAGQPLLEIDCSLIVTGNPCLDSQDGGAIYAMVVNRSRGPGVYLRQSAIYGSYIGTDVTGTIARGNYVGVDAYDATIGTKGAGMGNVISGNSYTGVTVSGGQASLLSNNLIGTNAQGTQPIPNGSNGVIVSISSGGTVIGGNTPSRGNVIVGSYTGIYLYGANGVVVQNNSIGLSNGVKMPNQTGVQLYETSDVSVIENIISGNVLGVHAFASGGLRNEIRLNSIYENSVLGIDLQSPADLTAVTPNDSDDGDIGPNNLQNFPVITSAMASGGSTRVQGTLTSIPNRTFIIDLYTNPACSPSGHGEGRSFLGTFNTTTNAGGVALIDQTYSTGYPSGTVITATATSTQEGTSEFSACALVEGPGVFSIDPPSFVIEGQNAVFTVRRNSGSVGAVTVQYSTAPGTATSNDFSAASGTLTFNDGEAVKTISVATVDDAIYEPAEKFTLSISNASGGASIGSGNSRSVTIFDNDPAPHVVISNVTVTEGNSGTTPATFTLTLTQAMPTPVTIEYYTSGGSAFSGDYQYKSGSVTFAPGQTVKTVTVNVIGDSFFEDDEYFYLFGYGTVSVNLGTGTILNDDEPLSFSVEDVTVTETDELRTATITLTATAPNFGAVYYFTSNGTAKAGTDYLSTSNVALFNNTTTATITVTIVGDDQPEPNEQFFINLQAFSITLPRNRITVNILNDDLGVGPSQQRIAVGESASYVIELGAPVASDSTITLQTTGGGVTVPNSVTIHAGESRASFDAYGVAEGSAGITVILPPSLGGLTHTVTATVYTARRIRFAPNELSLYVGQTVPISATLVPPSDRDLTVALESLSDAVELPATIVIPAGGTATFDLKAVKVGPVVVHATADGHETSSLFGHVTQTPITPAILRIAPPTGPAAGGTVVDVTGVHFRTECTISFDGIPAGVRFVSSTQLAVTTPPHDPATVDVQLSCGTDHWLFANGFTYLPATPEIAGVVPAFGNVAGGTEVRITGANFRSSCWPSFGGIAAPRAIVEGPASIAATVPAHAAGAVEVSLQCTGSDATRPAAFNYTTTPEPHATIQSVDPLAGSPGQPVTVTGLRFRTTDSLTFGSVPAVILSTRSGEHVVRIPELPFGKTSVTVTGADGNISTTGPIFTVLEAVPPIITAIAPSRLPAGAELRLDGRGFRPGYLFRIGGLVATIASLEYTSVVLRLDPAVAPGTYDVEVYNTGGHLAGIGPRVTVTRDGISIHDVDVPCSTTEGGGSVTITGSGFAAGAIVRFNSVLSTGVTVDGETTIRASIPAGEAGPAIISVTNPDGTNASLTGRFRYVSPFDPSGGCSGGGRSRSVRH